MSKSRRFSTRYYQSYHNRAATRFTPHAFNVEVEFLSKMPRILLTSEVYEDIYILTDEVNKEVSWLGTVERLGFDFMITEIFLLTQHTHNTSTHIPPGAVAELGTKLLEERADGLEVANKLRFWGHSHVNMQTSASPQDDQQMEEFEDNGCEFFIRAIVNKNGRMEFTLFLYELGLRINDAPWAVCQAPDNSRREMWQKEIEDKVFDLPSLPVQSYYLESGEYDATVLPKDIIERLHEAYRTEEEKDYA